MGLNGIDPENYRINSRNGIDSENYRINSRNGIDSENCRINSEKYRINSTESARLVS